MLPMIEMLLKNAELSNPIEQGDYIGKDGLYYCGKCNTPKETFLELADETCKVRTLCRCKAAVAEEQNKVKAAAKEKQRLDELCRACIPEEKYRQSTFAADNGSCPEAIATAKWYVENFPALFAENKGLMFSGSIGTGKTFAACCIANALIYTNRWVFVRKALTLIRDVGNFETEKAALSDIAKPDLLVIDDFGANQNSEFNTAMLCKIIDTRYSTGKPLVITTNLTPKDLKNAPSMELARIYDRTVEMCMCEKSPVILSGKSIRASIAAAKHGIK